MDEDYEIPNIDELMDDLFSDSESDFSDEGDLFSDSDNSMVYDSHSSDDDYSDDAYSDDDYEDKIPDNYTQILFRNFKKTEKWGEISPSCHISNNIFVRPPEQHHTDLARVGRSVSNGIHIWEFCWPIYMRNKECSIGLSTSEEILHCNGNKQVLGSTEHSWGWDIKRNLRYHNSMIFDCHYPAKYHVVPAHIIMVVNMYSGTCSFITRNSYMGVAFYGLNNKTVFPTINTSSAAKVSVKYLGNFEEHNSLYNIAMKNVIKYGLDTTGLPRIIRNDISKTLII